MKTKNSPKKGKHTYYNPDPNSLQSKKACSNTVKESRPLDEDKTSHILTVPNQL